MQYVLHTDLLMVSERHSLCFLCVQQLSTSTFVALHYVVAPTCTLPVNSVTSLKQDSALIIHAHHRQSWSMVDMATSQNLGNLIREQVDLRKRYSHFLPTRLVECTRTLSALRIAFLGS